MGSAVLAGHDGLVRGSLRGLATEDADLARNAPLKAVLDTLPQHVALLGADGTVLQVNRAWHRFGHLNGSRSEAATGVRSNYFAVCERATGPARHEADAALQGMRAVLSGALPRFSLEYGCQTPTQRLWFVMTVSPLGPPDAGLVVAHADVSEQKKFAALAYTDPLTGVGNRRRFTAFAAQALAAATRSGREVALILADLDGFKGVNDRYGHEVGDALLVAFAERLGGLFRRSDVVARLGGDEFGVVTPVAGADAFGRSLSRGLLRLGEPYTLGGRVLTVKASLGVALFPRHPGDLSALLRCADAALYRAKRQGGGVIVGC